MHHQPRLSKKFYHRNVALLVITAILIFAVSFTFITLNHRIRFSQFGTTTQTHNATLHLLPDNGNFNTGDTERVVIQLLTGGETINAVQTTIAYDTDKITVTDILTANSFCQLFPIRAVDVANGKATIACGLPTPGYNKTAGTVAELLLHLKQSGTFSLKFENSEVLANDGLGTNVLGSTTDAEYHVIDSPPASPAPAQQSGEPVVMPTLSVFSPTHPNSEQWYNQRDVKFTWPQASGYKYAHRFDQKPSSEQDGLAVTADNALSVTAPNDGVFYLHLAAIKAGVVGPATTSLVRIDATPPQKVELKASQTEVKPGDIVQLISSSKDETSGSQPAYSLRVNGGPFLTVGPSLNYSFNSPGTYTLVIRAFDNAGNYAEDQVVITVTNPGLFSEIWTRLISLISFH